eukprot:CAMPEP_0179287088 /NCGR_PEP_ID=MMETSP0797-20121207/40085_1 /TAXON_ID=47934 /ORGANISM="Dinophysis acuminata, Strain DAEP01" /LENGTH=70 /DNA_ID=CAMNT_0020996009 /DNA_START=368 /DNA_END=580 /DNA_ORIENTATION=-
MSGAMYTCMAGSVFKVNHKIAFGRCEGAARGTAPDLPTVVQAEGARQARVGVPRLICTGRQNDWKLGIST